MEHFMKRLKQPYQHNHVFSCAQTIDLIFPRYLLVILFLRIISTA